MGEELIRGLVLVVLVVLVVVKIKCPRCGHVWDYKGRLVLATCPSCGKKVRVEEHRVE